MRRSLLMIAALMFVVAFAPAHAGFYYGAGLGQGSADIDSICGTGTWNTCSDDDSDTDWRIYGGYKVMKFFSVEAGYNDMGQASTGGMTTGGDPSSMAMDASGFTVTALGTYPFGNSFHAFAKAGFLFWDGDIDIVDPVGGNSSFSDDGTDEMLGAGLVWDYKGPGSFRFEYEMKSLNDMDIDTFAAGMAFRWK